VLLLRERRLEVRQEDRIRSEEISRGRADVVWVVAVRAQFASVVAQAKIAVGSHAGRVRGERLVVLVAVVPAMIVHELFDSVVEFNGRRATGSS